MDTISPNNPAIVISPAGEEAEPQSVERIHSATLGAESAQPLFMMPVSAGFPSPAEDYMEKELNLNELLVRNPAATFFVRAAGDSMIGANIHTGDILVVDRSVEARDGRVVIAVIDGDLTVKRLRHIDGKIMLLPENSRYKPIEIPAEAQLEIWGVVTAVIHAL